MTPQRTRSGRWRVRVGSRSQVYRSRRLAKRAQPWTPERVIAEGLGPADVAAMLVAEGWRLEYRPWSVFMCEVVAVRGDEERELFDRYTTTRKHEAKILSEALGGCYGFTTGPAPSEWPEDWDHARHDPSGADERRLTMLQHLHQLGPAAIEAADWTALSDAGLMRALVELSRAAWQPSDPTPSESVTPAPHWYGNAPADLTLHTDANGAYVLDGPFLRFLRRLSTLHLHACQRFGNTALRRTVRHLFACRRLLHRGLDEAQRRSLLPTTDDLRVAWDEACAGGRVKAGDDEKLTLVEVVALLEWPAAFGPMAAQEVAVWCARLRSPDDVHVTVQHDGTSYTFSASAQRAANHAAPAIDVTRQLNAQAALAGVPVRFVVDEIHDSYSITAELLAQDSAAELDDLEEDRPAAPPIGRSLARRLNRGRRR